jgi:Glycosyl transferases group 1
MPRLLVFNCHEAWVHQLRLLDTPLDVIVDLPGRHTRGWDSSVRPLPPLARVVSLREVVAAHESYDCIIVHNLTDLLDVKPVPGPRLLVIHLTLEGMILEQRARTDPSEFLRTVHQYVETTSAHVVAVSKLKGRSWGFQDHIVPLTVDPADYLPWHGNFSQGLRVSSFILRRPRTLLWDFHRAAFSRIPVTLVGHNPELPGVQPSRDWNDLKQILQRHRFFVHTAHPLLEDGYNTAALEAMAAGLPIIGNRHPTSPIEHGVSGFLSDDPSELHTFALRLLHDQALALQMGEAAQAVVLNNFSPAAFRQAMLSAIHSAHQKWRPANTSQSL